MAVLDKTDSKEQNKCMLCRDDIKPGPARICGACQDAMRAGKFTLKKSKR